jgi:outer membrane beta-barrel protein
MESRFRLLFLITATLLLSGCGMFGRKEAPPPSAEPPGQVVDPQVERRKIKEPKIDSENFELGVHAGVMAIEDFGSNLSYNAKLAYHVTEGFFVEGGLGRSEGGLTSFEVLSGDARLLEDDERVFTYYNLSLGYNIFPGEAFLGEGRAYNTSLYLIAGLGSTRFAGDDRFTVNYGAGFRFLLTDTVALHLDFRNHLFDIDLLGEEKTAQNLEGTLGFSVFF